jgi:hypothetical protein
LIIEAALASAEVSAGAVAKADQQYYDFTMKAKIFLSRKKANY